VPALIACLALAQSPVSAETAPGVTRIDAPDRVLFVGNSYTYYNNSIHSYLRRMVEAADPGTERELRAMTISSATLPMHAGGIAQLVTEDRWDAVVLQGQSREPINSQRRNFRRAARAFAKHIRGTGAEPVLFMTWAHADRPEMTAELEAAYTDIGNQLEALVVPVGLAFARVARERPGLALRRGDGKHPTLAGTYLAAAVFYRSLFPHLPAEVDYFSTLDADTATFLQRMADASVREYLGRPL
jgi:hypothetical protein